MASSELVLAPQVDRNALKRSEMQIAASMENAGKKASIEMRKDLKKEITNGVAWGVSSGVKKSRGSMKALGLGVAAAAAMVIADTMDKTLGSLEDNIDRIIGKLDTIRDINNDAAAFGIGNAEYAALNVMGASQGLDSGDISGFMTGFTASLADEQMVAFKKIRDEQGTEKAFYDVLSTISTMKGSEREEMGIKVFGEDDYKNVSRFINKMSEIEASGGQLNLETLYSSMTGGNQLNLEALRAGLDRTALANQAYNKQNAATLANQLSTGVTAGQVSSVNAYNASNRNLEAAQMSALNLQIKAKIIADSLTVKQIEAGVITGNFMFDFFKNEIDLAKGDVGWQEYIKRGFKTSPMANALNDKEGQDFLNSIPQSPMRMAEKEVSDAFSAMFELIGNKLDAINNSLSNNDHKKY